MLALALGASRVEIAHVQYYGWATEEPRHADADARTGRARRGVGRGIAHAASRPHRHRRGRARLLRALSEALRRRLGPALAQRDAGGQGAALPRRRVAFPASNSGTCASIRSPTSGRIRRRSTHSAAPPGCRSRARAVRGARGFRRLPLPGLRAHRRRARDRPGLPSRAATTPGSPSSQRFGATRLMSTGAWSRRAARGGQSSGAGKVRPSPDRRDCAFVSPGAKP